MNFQLENVKNLGRLLRRPITWWSAALGVILLAGLWAGVVTPQTKTESSPAAKKMSGLQTKNPGAWPYADGYDEVAAAGEIYHVRFEDKHIRFVEVAVFPGAHTAMHGDPWPTI